MSNSYRLPREQRGFSASNGTSPSKSKCSRASFSCICPRQISLRGMKSIYLLIDWSLSHTPSDLWSTRFLGKKVFFSQPILHVLLLETRQTVFHLLYVWDISQKRVLDDRRCRTLNLLRFYPQPCRCLCFSLRQFANIYCEDADIRSRSLIKWENLCKDISNISAFLAFTHQVFNNFTHLKPY